MYAQVMRTTVNLPDDLLAQAKKVAIKTNTTLTQIIADALRVALDQRRRKAVKRKLKITTYGEGGVMPGVNLDDTSSLLDIMDSIAPRKRD
jgi:hypothetical protein